ncbi:MAG: ATP-binding protein [Acidobacteriota bacterium]
MASILIVDDIRANLDLLEDILSTQEYEVLRASNGLEALQVLQTHKVQLVISDAMMPKLDGFQLCREIKGNPQMRHIPFILYTGNYVSPEDEQFGYSIGVNRYVVKYSGIETLLNTVKELITAAPPEVTADVTAEEKDFLKAHNLVLIKKIEDKMEELEQFNNALLQKNKQLLESESRYRSLFENNFVAYFLLDPSRGMALVDCNHAAETLLGIPKHDLLKMSSPLPIDIKSMVEQHSESTVEFQYEGPSGDALICEAHAGKVLYDTQEYIIAYVRDVTVERQLREQLLQADKLSLLGRLSAGIAHEIRNPLAAISMNLQYLQSVLPKDNEDVREAIEATLQGAVRIDHIIENTLNFARPTKPVKKYENVNGVIQRAIELCRTIFTKKNIRVIPHLAAELPQLLLDNGQIQQVMINLLTNAADAVNDAGSIEVTTRLEQEKEKPYVVIEVKDDGIGIKKEDMEKIFSPFFTKKAHGTGLGLSMSQQIIQSHNGDIRVTSAVNCGTTFTITLPAHNAQEDAFNEA